MLEELRAGGTNAEIAVRLGISPDAVKYHISNMLGKLGVEDRHALAAWRPGREGVWKRVRGLLAAPAALATIGRPLAWAGAGLAGAIGVAALVVVLLIVSGGGGSGEDGPWPVAPEPTEPTAPAATATSVPTTTPQATPEPAATPNPDPVVGLSAGDGHTCAVRKSGELVCWGENTNGKTDVPQNGAYLTVTAGAYHTCALRESGEVECWGSNDQGQTDAPPGKYRSVAAGLWHSCAITESGELDCWGEEFGPDTLPRGGRFGN